MKFLLDTNFLLIPGKFGVDIFEELQKFGKPELFILDIIFNELGKIKEDGGKESNYANLALELIGLHKVNIISTEIPASKKVNVDTEITRTAEKEEMIVCTQDKKLRESLMKKGIRFVYLRQGKYLDASFGF